VAAQGHRTTRSEPLTSLPVSAEAVRFLDWYQGLWRRNDRPPSHHEVDPLDVPDLLPSLWYYECTEDGDFVCRYAGDLIDRHWQQPSVQFKRLSAILPPDSVETVFNRIRQCLRRMCIGHGWTEQRADPVSGRGVERCFAPVSGPDGRPSAVVGVALYGHAINNTAVEAPAFVKRLGLYDPVTLELVAEID